MRKVHFSMWLLAVAAALPVGAGTFSYSGDTTGAPTFNRPEFSTSSFTPGVPTGLSVIAETVPFQFQEFSVSVGGSYSLISNQLFDGVIALYQGSFNPASPLTNLLLGNDDSAFSPAVGFSNQSALSLLLTANTSYFLVTTGFSSPDPDLGPADAGRYTNDISGPGTVIPEPLSVLGVLALGFWGTRKKLHKPPTTDA